MSISNEQQKNQLSTLEMAIEAVNMAWWEMNIVTGEVSYHKRKTDILGYRKEDFRHYRDFMALVHPDDYEPAMEAMRNHFKGIAPTYETEYRIRNSQGEYKWFYDKGTIISRDEKGKPLKIIGFVIDVTHQKEIEQSIRDLNAGLEVKIKERTAELMEANRAKSELLSRMSHELRTPLNSILGFAQLLGMGTLDSRQQRNIENIVSAGRNLLELVNEVLEINQMDSGITELERSRVNVGESIRHSIDPLKVFADKKQVKILIVTDPEGIEIIADRSKVEQVLKILADNAIRYNSPGGTVTVTASVDNSGEMPMALIKVADTGSGIDPEYLPKLFNPFERIGQQKEDQGVGLGLALAKRMIQAMGGSIRVASEPGKGSTFTVEMPAAGI
jgi:PAS domain S-box-containing protein